MCSWWMSSYASVEGPSESVGRATYECLASRRTCRLERQSSQGLYKTVSAGSECVTVRRMRTANGPTTARFGLMRSGLASISSEGDVTVKHRRSPLSFHFSLYRGGWWVRRGGDGDGETLVNGKGDKNRKRWEWNVDVPLGSSVSEISKKGGPVWELFVLDES